LVETLAYTAKKPHFSRKKNQHPAAAVIQRQQISGGGIYPAGASIRQGRLFGGGTYPVAAFPQGRRFSGGGHLSGEGSIESLRP